MPLQIPAGTQPGETIVMRGRGLPPLSRGRTGDLRVVVNVAIPRRLSREQRELLERLAGTMTDENLRVRRGDARRSSSARWPGERPVERPRRGVWQGAGAGRDAVIRLAVRVARAEAEIVLAELLELVPSGLEERDAGPDAVEYVIYGAPGEVPDLGELRAVAGHRTGRRVDLRGARRLGGALEGLAPAGRRRHGASGACACARRGSRRWTADGLELVIDPGQAFGTGAHHTTRLCLELLLGLEPEGATGRLGLRDRRAGDRGRAARLRAGAGVRQRPERARGRARERGAPTGPRWRCENVNLRRAPGPWAPTVCANLVRPLLLDVAGHLERPPERLIASGLLREEADEVVAAFAGHGLREAERRVGGEWAAVLLVGG